MPLKLRDQYLPGDLSVIVKELAAEIQSIQDTLPVEKQKIYNGPIELIHELGSLLNTFPHKKIPGKLGYATGIVHFVARGLWGARKLFSFSRLDLADDLRSFIMVARIYLERTIVYYKQAKSLLAGITQGSAIRQQVEAKIIPLDISKFPSHVQRPINDPKPLKSFGWRLISKYTDFFAQFNNGDIQDITTVNAVALEKEIDVILAKTDLLEQTQCEQLFALNVRNFSQDELTKQKRKLVRQAILSKQGITLDDAVDQRFMVLSGKDYQLFQQNQLANLFTSEITVAEFKLIITIYDFLITHLFNPKFLPFLKDELLRYAQPIMSLIDSLNNWKGIFEDLSQNVRTTSIWTSLKKINPLSSGADIRAVINTMSSGYIPVVPVALTLAQKLALHNQDHQNASGLTVTVLSNLQSKIQHTLENIAAVGSTESDNLVFLTAVLAKLEYEFAVILNNLIVQTLATDALTDTTVDGLIERLQVLNYFKDKLGCLDDSHAQPAEQSYQRYVKAIEQTSMIQLQTAIRLYLQQNTTQQLYKNHKNRSLRNADAVVALFRTVLSSQQITPELLSALDQLGLDKNQDLAQSVVKTRKLYHFKDNNFDLAITPFVPVVVPPVVPTKFARFKLFVVTKLHQLSQKITGIAVRVASFLRLLKLLGVIQALGNWVWARTPRSIKITAKVVFTLVMLPVYVTRFTVSLLKPQVTQALMTVESGTELSAPASIIDVPAPVVPEVSATQTQVTDRYFADVVTVEIDDFARRLSAAQNQHLAENKLRVDRKLECRLDAPVAIGLAAAGAATLGALYCAPEALLLTTFDAATTLGWLGAQTLALAAVAGGPIYYGCVSRVMRFGARAPAVADVQVRNRVTTEPRP